MLKLIKKNRLLAKIKPAALTDEIAADLESRGYVIVGYSRPRLAAVNGVRRHG